MKIIMNKIILGLGMLDCVTAIIICASVGADLGQYGYVALAVGAIVFAILLMAIPIIKFIKDNFNLSYDKENGLKVQEQESDKDLQ